MTSPLDDLAYALEHTHPAHVESETLVVRGATRADDSYVTFVEAVGGDLRVEFDHRLLLTATPGTAAGSASAGDVGLLAAIANGSHESDGPPNPTARVLGAGLLELTGEDGVALLLSVSSTVSPPPATPGATVEVLHSTTMWNEGFEHAYAPYLRVVLPSRADAEALVAWSTSPAGRLSPMRYIDFELKVAPAYSETPVVDLAEARRRVEVSTARFEGI